MNEREILKRLVETWDNRHDDGVRGWVTAVEELRACVTDAKSVLAQNTDPEPEHPAVEAYRKWRDSGNLPCNTLSEPFLAGWKLALWHVADNFEGQEKRHLVAASDATPTQLP